MARKLKQVVWPYFKGGLAIFQGLLAWQNDPKAHNERQILKDEQTEEEMGGQL